MTTRRFDAIVRTLRANKHKLTPQRLAIVGVLAESRGHPSAEAIYEQLKGTFPTMSLATVYRNIQLIKSLGEVLELGFPDGGNRYDGKKPYPHPHLVCIRCKKIMDPDLESLKDMTTELSKETGFTVVSHRLDFFGLCPECAAKKEQDR
ncbi:MAG TPA: transcriptional repressor [Desulfobacteraceae bacterium]|nr:transcriptional repressor [Desulfobacteraceae bacterium]